MANLEIAKKGKNFILYTNGMIKIENVRFSFPHLDKPFKGKNAKPDEVGKYSIKGMIKESTHKEVFAVINARIAELMAEGKVKRLPGKDKFFRDGNDEKEEVYEDHWIISASEVRKPAVRNKRAQLVTEPEDIRDLIEGGYWGHMLIRPWFQNNDWGTKVNAGLVGVQHTKDDQTFGEGRVDDTDAWDAEGGDDDEADDDL